MAQLLIPEGTAPATPGAGVVSLYAKADKRLYTKDDDGVESALGKPWVERVTTITSAATLTPSADDTDQYVVSALSTPATIAIPTGTPTQGQKLIFRIKDNGSARALTWTTTAGGYRGIGILLPTTTEASKTLYVGCIYNITDGYWDVLAVAQEQ